MKHGVRYIPDPELVRAKVAHHQGLTGYRQPQAVARIVASDIAAATLAIAGGNSPEVTRAIMSDIIEQALTIFASIEAKQGRN